LNDAGQHLEPSGDAWSGYKQLEESESQNLGKEPPHPQQNNILQTSTFSMGEIHGSGIPKPAVITPWTGTNNNYELHSIFVQSEQSFA
jgi:hypothetical protein